MKIFTILFGIWLSFSPAVHAKEIDLCRRQVTNQLAIEHRLFRSILYGEPTPKDAPISHVTFSKSGDSWIKTAKNKWQSLAPGFESTTWSDSTMEQESAIPNRRGIFATKRLLTSDLIPHITESTRTFDCRLRIYCEAIKQSANTVDNSSTSSSASSASTTNNPLQISISGCEQKELPVIKECSPKFSVIEQSNALDAMTFCNTVRSELYEREKSLIALSTEYDAAYRSTIQFAGDFDLFIAQLRWPMTNTIRQVTNVIGSLHRIPCFVASCDDYPLKNQYEDN